MTKANQVKQIQQLWQVFRKAIDDSYAVGQRANDDDLGCLRDYVENLSWSDDLAALLGRESANERQHRRNEECPKDFSIRSAAMLLLMHNAADGAFKTEMPKATTFLVFRRTAMEATLIGYLCRHALTAEWCKAVRSLDYAQLMKVAA